MYKFLAPVLSAQLITAPVGKPNYKKTVSIKIHSSDGVTVLGTYLEAFNDIIDDIDFFWSSSSSVGS